MTIWRFLSNKLLFGKRAVLLYVVNSTGSSPGRKGFAMVVGEKGELYGTIGGGIMEVKLVELAKHQLKGKSEEVLIKKQYHNKQDAHNQSGMICSGSQTVVLIPLSEKDDDLLQIIITNLMDRDVTTLCIKFSGLTIVDDETPEYIPSESEEPFTCVIKVLPYKRVHLFGGGHVGLALSNLLALLEYNVIIYDDRTNLNTLEQNESAEQIRILDYDEVSDIPDLLPEDTVLLVTHSYRTDKLLLQRLYNKPFSFIGMMGSEAKVEKLLEELEEEGISREALSHVRAPIGLNIFSKTAMEIAVSIAGELILHHNKDLPTGRPQK